jgi:hypothetical protein
MEAKKIVRPCIQALRSEAPCGRPSRATAAVPEAAVGSRLRPGERAERQMCVGRVRFVTSKLAADLLGVLEGCFLGVVGFDA